MKSAKTLLALALSFGCAPASPPTPDNETAKEALPEPDQAARPEDGSDPVTQAAPPVEFHPHLAEYVAGLEAGFPSIADDRKAQLDKLALFVETKRDADEVARLTFICTHNSRRSHLSQLWAAVAAAHYGIDGVETFSGGTESTAFNPRAVAAMRRAGFEIEAPPEDTENPHYAITYAPAGPELEAFSKKYDDAPNPKTDFAAVMTCSQADENCPVVSGAAYRVPIPYVDPKASDGTPEETATYDERARQIATEMFYLFSRVGEVEGSLVATSDAKAPDADSETEHGLTWYLDADLAYAEAKKSGKPVFIDFFGTWCTACKTFSAKTGSDEKLNAALKDVVLLKVYDTSPMYETYRDDARFPELKTSLPFFVVTDAEGEVRFKTADHTKTVEMVAALGGVR